MGRIRVDALTGLQTVKSSALEIMFLSLHREDEVTFIHDMIQSKKSWHR